MSEEDFLTAISSLAQRERTSLAAIARHEGLSPEDQKMIEQALAGTTGQKPLVRR